jgi:hypothetical protein
MPRLRRTPNTGFPSPSFCGNKLRMDIRTLAHLALILACSAPIVGCGDDPDKQSTDSSDGAAPQDAAAPVTLDCPTYCNEIQGNCAGANTQYSDTQSCIASCASFAVGTSTVTDTSGNTLGCRIHYAGDPAKTDPGTHCVQAGPGGLPITADTDGGTPAGCGTDVCEIFCKLEIQACGSLDVPLDGCPKASDGTMRPIFQYRNMEDCLDQCKDFDKTHPYRITAVGDSLACRLKEATLAAISVMDAMDHCFATGPVPENACAGTASP